MKKIIIAIDGHSSCGKSTFAKSIASKLGYLFIDTGAMYRGVTLYALENGVIDGGDVCESSLISLLDSIEISFNYNEKSNHSDLWLGERNVEDKIRSIEVSSWVSRVSSIREVRQKLVAMQQAIGGAKGVVMDGRDIGTTVFPNAELKIFMTASVDVRAQRRFDELTAKGDSVTLEQIKKNIADRDFQDENREESPLRRADDAILLDNSSMSVAEQMEWVDKIINERCQ